ncbi:DUF523 domain-containing protein [Anaerofustis butyriciformans]|uniref:DUF523 domain-containing protein n=1 Tax=Anaerofustis butyriciformans TaxID=3108533 RepID=UPI003F8BABEC
MSKENIIVSACLFGENCKYSGGNNEIEKEIIKKIEKKYNVILCCPECLGGLSTPREPSEIRKGKVFSKSGKDVTDEYKKGAMICLNIAKENNVKLALMKANSPSCGNKKIYDGSFSSVLIDGKGITAKLFEENGIEVISEKELEKLF